MEEYACRTICAGKLFWLKDSNNIANARKCTQSIVQLCSSVKNVVAVPYIKKTFHKRTDYRQEKRCLKRFKNCPGFPQILQSNNETLELDLSFAGVPIVSDNLHHNIPKDCTEQIKALGDSLAAAKVRHNDLVPHNFLIDTSTKRISLIDFGRSKIFPETLKAKKKTINIEQQNKEQQHELIVLANILCNPKELQKYQQKQLKPKYNTAVSRLKQNKNVDGMTV